MHIIYRESHGLEETDVPRDLGQSPADLVALSFSDSDLGAFAAGWHRAQEAGTPLPSLRLANIATLRHPLSVDVYCEQTLAGVKGILVRLSGGESYWSYGLAGLQDLARRDGVALAVLPADGRPDARLDALSSLPVSTLRRLQHLCDAGGAVAAQAALAQLALAAGLYAKPVTGLKTVPDTGFYRTRSGIVAAADIGGMTGRPCAVVTFYRSYLTAADTAPVDALLEALEAHGYEAVGLFAPSLKPPSIANWLRSRIAELKPAVILNATAFSAKGSDEETSPLDVAGCPVFQVALSTAGRKLWLDSERGLSPADLAMHVVLPEVDGRIFAGVTSFKSSAPHDPDLQFSRLIHQPDPERVAAVVARAVGWHRLAQLPASQVRPGIVLSTYPGRDDQIAHAVGLDAIASTDAILTELAQQGFAVTTAGHLGERLLDETETWPLAA
ncbi:MAG: cobaltochelatase subunit CobN, partial [Hyphomicrobiaceae bacterium]